MRSALRSIVGGVVVGGAALLVASEVAAQDAGCSAADQFPASFDFSLIGNSHAPVGVEWAAWLQQLVREGCVLPPAPGQVHVIKATDTLDSIGEQYGLSVEELVELNPRLNNPMLGQQGAPLFLTEDYLVVGNVLYLAKAPPVAVEPSATPTALGIEEEESAPGQQQESPPEQQQQESPPDEEAAEPAPPVPDDDAGDDTNAVIAVGVALGLLGLVIWLGRRIAIRAPRPPPGGGPPPTDRWRR